MSLNELSPQKNAWGSLLGEDTISLTLLAGRRYTHRGSYDAEQFTVWYGDEKEEADDILLLGSKLIRAEQKAWKNGHHADRKIASLNDCNTI